MFIGAGTALKTLGPVSLKSWSMKERPDKLESPLTVFSLEYFGFFGNSIWITLEIEDSRKTINFVGFFVLKPTGFA